MLRARQLEQGPLAWHQARALRLTASYLPLSLGHFGGLAVLVSKKSQKSHASSLQSVRVQQQTFDQQLSSQHQCGGRTHEAQAAAAYEMRRWSEGRPVTLDVAGWWIHPDAAMLAASPDRFFSNSNGMLRLLEMKCPLPDNFPPAFQIMSGFRSSCSWHVPLFLSQEQMFSSGRHQGPQSSLWSGQQHCSRNGMRLSCPKQYGAMTGTTS